MVGVAEADATRAKGLAEGDAVRARGMAEAEAIKARADALAENQDAVIGQQLAERWPEIVEAAAKPFGDIDQLIVLNGAKGLSETLAQALSQGATGLDLARQLLAGKNGSRKNGAAHTDTEQLAASDTNGSDRYARVRAGPDRQHLCHHLRRNFAGDHAHLGVERLLHVVGVEAGA